jgi:hypothetical protein
MGYQDIRILGYLRLGIRLTNGLHPPGETPVSPRGNPGIPALSVSKQDTLGFDMGRFDDLPVFAYSPMINVKG